MTTICHIICVYIYTYIHIYSAMESNSSFRQPSQDSKALRRKSSGITQVYNVMYMFIPQSIYHGSLCGGAR